jgi:hypothetical protein
VLFVTVRARKFVVQGLKIYDQDPVVGSGHLGEECDCREKNAAESLAVGVGHRTAVAVGYDSIGSEGHLARDNYSDDKEGIDCSLFCGWSSQLKCRKFWQRYLTPDGLGTIDFHSIPLCFH